MTKRKQESVRIVRSDDLNYFETKIIESLTKDQPKETQKHIIKEIEN